MRRPWVLVVGLVVVFLLGLGLTFAIWLSKEVALGVGRAGDDTKSYRLTGARVDGELQPDGALQVREAIRFQFSGSFSGAYRDIPLEDGQEISNVVVSEGQTVYRPGGNTVLGGFGLPGTYGTETVRKGDQRYLRVVWHYSATDETRIFAIRYRFTGLVKAYDDAVDLYWQVWGDEWQGSLDALAATLTLPHPVDVSRERVYAHPGHVEGVVVAGAEQIQLGARDVPREQYVELRALLPRDVLDANPTAAQIIREPAWDRIQEEERKDYADAQRDADRVEAIVDHPALAGFGTVAGGVLLGLLVWPLAYRRYGREPDVPGTAIEYLPEPPDDAPPAVAQALTTQADSGGGGDRMAATFLDLIVRGRFVARVGDTDEGADLLLEQGDRSVHVESWEKPADRDRRERAARGRQRGDPARRHVQAARRSSRRRSGRPTRRASRRSRAGSTSASTTRRSSSCCRPRAGSCARSAASSSSPAASSASSAWRSSRAT